MRRREFLAFAAGAAAWPLAARGQPATAVRRIGVIVAEPPEAQYFPVLEAALAERGWEVGGNLAIDYRLGTGTAEGMVRRTREIMALQPDIVVAGSAPVVAAVRSESATVPIIFLGVPDPVAAGFVASLEKPGGNTTGLLSYDPAIIGRMLELLTAAAPAVRQVAVVFNGDIAPVSGTLLRAAMAKAPSLGLEILSSPLRIVDEVETTLAALAGRNSGLLVLPDGFALHLYENESFTYVRRDVIIANAAQYGLPAIYTLPEYADAGGLMSYGVAPPAFYRAAAGYVDGLLRGAVPADLPVGSPEAPELILNLRTAEALGLTLSADMIAGADRLIR